MRIGLGLFKTKAKTTPERVVADHPVGTQATGANAPSTSTTNGKRVTGKAYGEGGEANAEVPTMRGGNGSMLRHELLKRTDQRTEQSESAPDLEAFGPDDLLMLRDRLHNGELDDPELRAIHDVLQALPNAGLNEMMFATAALEHAKQALGLEPLPMGLADEEYDGKFVAAGRAWESADVDGATLFVGGMKSDLAKTIEAMSALEAVTGEHVVAIHNSTSGAAYDYFEIAGDIAQFGASKAAKTLASTLLEQLSLVDERGPNAQVRIAGHSQGTLIISRAIELVRDELEKTMTRGEAEHVLSRLHVRTFAGTAFDYPDGPQYVHSRNDCDPCPATRVTSSSTSAPALVRGASKLARLKMPHAPKLGRGAVLNEFHDNADGTARGKHRFATYLKHLPAT